MQVDKKDLKVFLKDYKEPIEKISLLLLEANKAFSVLSKKSILAEVIINIWKNVGYFEIDNPAVVELDEYILEEAKDVSIRAIYNKNQEAFKEVAKMIANYLYLIETTVEFCILDLIEVHKINNRHLYEEKEDLHSLIQKQAKKEGTKVWER